MDIRIDEEDETGALTATYIESRSSGNGRIDIIVSMNWLVNVTLADIGMFERYLRTRAACGQEL